MKFYLQSYGKLKKDANFNQQQRKRIIEQQWTKIVHNFWRFFRKMKRFIISSKLLSNSLLRISSPKSKRTKNESVIYNSTTKDIFVSMIKNIVSHSFRFFRQRHRLMSHRSLYFPHRFYFSKETFVSVMELLQNEKALKDFDSVVSQI